jgi:hypothetical protein
MEIIQWALAAGTATFVAMVGYYQWRTAEQKAALESRAGNWSRGALHSRREDAGSASD